MNTFPVLGVTFSWGSKSLNKEAIRLLNPFMTDKTQTSAMVTTITPQTDTIDMILIALCDFLEIR